MDDGIKTKAIYAAPILRKYGFKANVYMITNRVKDEDQPWNTDKIVTLSLAEMKQNKDVFSYHGHTHGMHYFMDGVGAINKVPYNETLKDLMASRKFLADNGFETTHFAYPFGSNSPQARASLLESGYTTAFTTQMGYNKVGDNPLLLKRWNIGPSMTKEQFKKVLNVK